jgi:hypothetical protein
MGVVIHGFCRSCGRTGPEPCQRCAVRRALKPPPTSAPPPGTPMYRSVDFSLIRWTAKLWFLRVLFRRPMGWPEKQQ